MIAALFVETGGVYFNLPGVDPWDAERDARKYDGPYPVIAHPPCERWGRYWFGSPAMAGKGIRLKKGDDGGCFEAALNAVRRFGGVLEHPEGSHAWRHFELVAPPHHGGWVSADFLGGWTCCVEQGNYGHPARKKTWLYACKTELPSLKWGKSEAKGKLEESFRTKEIAIRERRARKAAGIAPLKRISHYERLATPIPFRDLLINLARISRPAPPPSESEPRKEEPGP